MLKTDFFGARCGPRVGAEGARLAQADAVLDARGAGVADGEGVDAGFERVEKDFAGGGLGEIAEDDRVFEIDGRRLEEVCADEVAHLRVKLLVTADEAQLFHELAREEGDDAAIVHRPGAVELDGVMHFGVEHRLKDGSRASARA